MQIDPDSPVPPYQQVAAHLRAQIADGTITGRLPSYMVLTAETGLSTGVIQRAIRVLVHEGVVVTSQGIGVFVRRD